jgi:polyhydroxyalkanoate synthesis regulator phasin
MQFSTAEEARKITSDLHRQLQQVRYNKDMRKMLANIDKMIDELSSLEVKARQAKKPAILDSKREEIEKAIDHLTKLIMIMRLID